MIPVIGICGRRNTGKNVIASILQKNYGFTVIAIADPMKIIVNRVFAVPKKYLWDDSNHRTEKPEIRAMLQSLGTDWGRKFDQEIWLKHLFVRIDAWIKKGIDPWGILDSESRTIIECKGIVVADIRLNFEVAALKKKLNAVIIGIQRTIPRDTKEDKHETEQDVDNIITSAHIDYMIENNSTLNAFKKQAKKIIAEILTC